MTICDSICRMVCSATPTTIRTEVPPRARYVVCEKWKCAMKIDGVTATAARNSAPGKVSRLSTRSK